MTPQERQAIEAVTDRALTWRVSAVDARFVELRAQPCPLLNADGTCSVYAVRPFNCRRFLCGREATEAWDQAPRLGVPLRVVTDRAFRRQYAVNERHAQRWARSHGWTE